MSREQDGHRLSPALERTLASVLDEIIPPSEDGKLPGAGQLGLAAYVQEVLRKSPDIAAMVVDGLSALDALARERSVASFGALPGPERVEVLMAQPFVLILALHVYAGYYQNARVLEALGLEPRPPHPKGYEIEAGDLTLLDPVRRRGKLYRDC